MGIGVLFVVLLFVKRVGAVGHVVDSVSEKEVG